MFVKCFEYSVVFFVCLVVHRNHEKNQQKIRNSLHNIYLTNHLLSFTACSSN